MDVDRNEIQTNSQTILTKKSNGKVYDNVMVYD